MLINLTHGIDDKDCDMKDETSADGILKFTHETF